MLQKLFIQNYAIIESIEIFFSKKLNIITGETGAGKSILVGALGLILGERADSSILFNAQQKCIVEGMFLIGGRKDIQQFLAENDLDAEKEIIIRREMAANGKSRAFINDTPVNLSQLKQLTSLLVDLHQQFDTLELGDNDFQRAVIDALAGHSAQISKYQALYREYSNTQKELAALKESQANATKESDYNKFLFKEFEDIQLKENELEALDAELKILGNAENIKSTLSKVSYPLNESDDPVVQQLKSLANLLQSVQNFHPGIPALINRFQSVQIELRDIAAEVENLNDKLNFDAERIQWVSDRLAQGYKLLKKHGVQTTAELLVIRDTIQQQLDKVLHLDTDIAALEKQAAGQLKEVTQLAKTLTANREKQVAPFEKQTNKLLAQVGMPNAGIKVQITAAPLHIFGADAIAFLFDANKSNRFEPLKKVASGGELSRLMLCIKSLVAASVQLPTLIFDEIDSGISGEAARQVGIIMKDLGKAHQVIAITHQPQIAAKADLHLFVYKEEKKGKVNTQIKVLSDTERVDAIARMLSGEKPTITALENAKEMMTS
ncbi:DNA repair protein RecN [Terrimonas sp.]|uniref:DNA repair protein RecN n=1 Tax=Terrimonas sp. TaxID=1914338 RepID=UPI000D50FB8A|nr:DNA repair protein RecN [Terrimonas sp.]PVD51831.1 DNA repair protein RecN [Terrimonas sp.]